VACRKIIDDCASGKLDDKKSREEKGHLVRQRDHDLLSFGFISPQHFMEFNDEMCLAELMECLKYTKVCDKCKGFDGTPPCTITCDKGKSWMDLWTGSSANYRYLYVMSYYLLVHYMDLSTFKSKPLKEDDPLVAKLQSDHKVLKAQTVVEPEKARSFEELRGGEYKTGNCPEGHGFYVKTIRESRFPIDWNKEVSMRLASDFNTVPNR
jgi:hypothetical protein